MAIKVLITGSNGQLARALGERVAGRRDLDVVCVGRPTLDLEDLETIAPALRTTAADIVINAAAYTAVDRAEDERERAMRVNGDAAGAVAHAARSINAKLIQISTDYVYDGAKPSPYVESDDVAPQGVYGQSKLLGEMQVRAAYPDAVIMRTAWVYSPFGRNFVKTMLELARTRGQLSVVDDQVGNPTSAHDLADALLALTAHWRAEPGKGAGQIYHCAGSGHATWCTFARQVFAASGDDGGPAADVLAIESSAWPTKAVRPKNSRLDCRKLNRDFGWFMPAWQTSVNHVVRRLSGGRLICSGEGP
ncbi:MAG: dTDP-4-dehydrorhamnose reductase [Hyphomicrobiaceae bacterium]